MKKIFILKCNYMFKRYKGNISCHNQEKIFYNENIEEIMKIIIGLNMSYKPPFAFCKKEKRNKLLQQCLPHQVMK